MQVDGSNIALKGNQNASSKISRGLEVVAKNGSFENTGGSFFVETALGSSALTYGVKTNVVNNGLKDSYGVNSFSFNEGSSRGFGGEFSSFGDGNGQRIGVSGNAGGSGISFGVSGNASGVGINYGVYGSASGGTSNYAGYFNGEVLIVKRATLNAALRLFPSANAPSSPERGDIYYDANDDTIKFFNGTIWKSLSTQ